MSLEGEGGELVSYPSLQECAIWFENGEPCHTLFFFTSVIPLSVPTILSLSLSPAAPPVLRRRWPQVCLLSDLTAVSAAGLNDVCADMGLTGRSAGK